MYFSVKNNDSGHLELTFLLFMNAVLATSHLFSCLSFAHYKTLFLATTAGEINVKIEKHKNIALLTMPIWFYVNVMVNLFI